MFDRRLYSQVEIPMNPRTEKLLKRWYSDREHPYQTYRKTVMRYSSMSPGKLIVDAGCGHTAPDLVHFKHLFQSLIGLDVVQFDKQVSSQILLAKNDLTHICLKNEVADVVVSKSVIEHLVNPLAMFSEVFRILKKGGYFIFLTPNDRDYASIAAMLIPNRLHPYVVSRTEGRMSDDTFPTYFRCNSYDSISTVAQAAGFTLEQLDYLSQYPAYLLFNPILFTIGALYDRILTRIEFLKTLRGWLLVILKKG